MTATTTPPITADEFLRRHGDESGVELVRGLVVRLPMPGSEHGEICANATILIGGYVKAKKFGRVLGNDTFIRTATDPDSFRGADLCVIHFERLPASVPSPKGPTPVPPDLVVEVRSPSNTYAEMMDKATEYLRAGVRAVVVIDPPTQSAGVFRPEELPQRFHNGDTFEVPEVLPGFAVPVKDFFGA